MLLKKISSAMLILTHACNLKCRYCFVHQEPCHMTYETAKAAAEFLIKNAEEEGVTPRINFFGGEPTLMWDSIIVPLTNWIRQEYKKPFNLSMTSNCTLLNDERIKFMKDNNIGLLFSIDGAKETQDYNRPYHNGEGSFDSLQELIPKMPINFPGVTFRSTVIPPTCHNVYKNIMFAAANGFSNFFIVPNVFEEWDEESRNILKSEFDKYVEYYISEYRVGRKPIKFNILEKAFGEIKQINYAVKNEQFRTMTKCMSCGKCGLGSGREGSIHPNGNIYTCQQMTSNEGEDGVFCIGNIYTGIDDIKREALIKMFDENKAVGPNCDSCKYNRICDGGCVANNYLINGSLSVLPDTYCWWKQLVLDGAIKIMQTLGDEKNEMFKKKWEAIK